MKEDKCNGCEHRYCYYNESCGYCNDCNDGSNFTLVCDNENNNLKE